MLKNVINVSFAETGTVADRQRPMREGSSLEVYGTHAFEVRFILDNIGYGNTYRDQGGQIRRDELGHTISLYPWIEFVPEAYRSTVLKLVRDVARPFLGAHAEPYVLINFAHCLRDTIFAKLEPIGR